MTIVLIAVALYLVAAALLVADVRRDGDRRARTWLVPAGLALALHAAAHLLAWRAAGGADLHFFAALSLVGLGMAVLTSLVGGSGRMAALGVVVFPLAALTLLGYQLQGHEPPPPARLAPATARLVRPARLRDAGRGGAAGDDVVVAGARTAAPRVPPLAARDAAAGRTGNACCSARLPWASCC